MRKPGNESLKRLERLGNFISEYSVRNKNDENIPVYSVTNDKGFCTGYFSKDVSSKDRTTYKIVPYGCFAYNPSRINVGSIDWQHCEERVIVSPLYVVFKVSDQIDRRYLLHYLKSDVALTYIKAKSSGSVRDNLKLSVLQEFPINLRSLEEQKKVADVLDAATALAAKRRRQLALLDTLTQSRFVEMFGDPITNTKNWNIEKLSALTTKIGSGATPKGGRESYIDEGIHLIRSMNVYDGWFEYKGLAHINNEQAKQLNNVVVMKADVLINITGASVARSCVVPEDVLPARVNQHVSIIRCIDKMINPIFLNNVFLNDRCKNALLEIGESGGATRQAITKQQLEDFQIIVPPISLQNEFAEFVSEVDRQKAALRRSLTALTTLKSALMQDYFGEA